MYLLKGPRTAEISQHGARETCQEAITQVGSDGGRDGGGEDSRGRGKK